MFKLAGSSLVGILIYKPLASIPDNGAKNLIVKFLTRLLEDYCLIPGNGTKYLIVKFLTRLSEEYCLILGKSAKKFIDRFSYRPNLFIFVSSLKYPTVVLPRNFVTVVGLKFLLLVSLSLKHDKMQIGLNKS